jgi:hypothetical protein
MENRMPARWWASFWIVLVVMAVVAGLTLTGHSPAEATKGKGVVGAWYVDTIGAPFAPHGITFHADGTLDLTNPDAAEATNSSSAGMGSWVAFGKDEVRGQFFEVNADKGTNQFTTLLVVKFEIKVSDLTFRGPANASYYDGNRNLVNGPFPAMLRGQRFDVDSPVPDPVETP